MYSLLLNFVINLSTRYKMWVMILSVDVNSKIGGI